VTGTLFMLTSALAFSLMSVLVKIVGQRIPSQEIVLARAIVSLVLSVALLRHAGVPLWGHDRALLCLRGVFGFLGLSCVFYSVTHLPLAEATVIQYLHPSFTALLAALFLAEAISPLFVLTSAISLAGVVLVAKPGFLFGSPEIELPPLGLAAAIGGAFFSGCAYVTVRKLSAREHPLVIVFYFPLVAVPATLPTLIGRFVWPEGIEWLLLAAIGVATQIGQVSLTRGVQLMPAGRATAISYMQVAFATLLGVAIFGEIPTFWTWMGAGLIVAGTVVNSRLKR
jgi:drug/metabolite transporter (DMT)-like permease